MDSSIANAQSTIEAIKARITDGSLDAQTLHKRLIYEIERELSKPSEEVNMTYVETCEDLLDRLNIEKENTVASHYFCNLEAIRQAITPKERKPAYNKLRFVVAFCAMLLVLFSGALFQQFQVLKTQSPDEEQYIIQGAKVPPDLTANAAEYRESGFWDTGDWNEAVKLYGKTPCVPTWIPEGWYIDYYSIDFTQTFIRFAITYSNDVADYHLIFDSVTYDDITNLRAEIEQNQSGEYLILGNGSKVYLTDNISNISVCWVKDKTKYVLSGPVSQEELLQCIISIE